MKIAQGGGYSGAGEVKFSHWPGASQQIRQNPIDPQARTHYGSLRIDRAGTDGAEAHR
jgi:hypothetical protein